MVIRPYTPADAPDLSIIHRALNPDSSRSVDSLAGRMEDVIAAGGSAWVLRMAEALIGYAAVFPVPGLVQVMNLEGGIAPSRQRQGFGSMLLTHVIDEMKARGPGQLSQSVMDLDSPAARFLRHHHFYLEHEELLLYLADLTRLPPVPAGNVRTYRRAEATNLFLRLYQESFDGLPWNQPYSTTEVAAELERPSDLRFLVQGSRAVGFAWARQVSSTLGEIEPLGISRKYQGRGLGRTLVLDSLHYLAGRGVDQVRIGAWRNNEVAIHLYQGLGFIPRERISYLAYDL